MKCTRIGLFLSGRSEATEEAAGLRDTGRCNGVSQIRDITAVCTHQVHRGPLPAPSAGGGRRKEGQGGGSQLTWMWNGQYVQ